MLGKRLAIGIPMAVGYAAVLLLDERLHPWYPLWGVTAVAVLMLAAAELVVLLGATGAKPSGNAVIGGVLALVAANWAPHLVGATSPGGPESPFDPVAPVHALAWPMLTFAAVVMVAFVAQGLQFRRPGATTATIAGTVLAVAYVGVLGSFMVQMRWLEGPGHGLIPLAALVATAKGADTGAYTLGRLAGRHKLWPSLSPNKTVEGALGGLAAGVAGALLVFAVAREVLAIPTLGLPAAAGFGVAVSVAAQLGDLMESMIKRDCAAKDASAAVPGFGGVLDVIDSLIFAGPVAFAYWLAFGP